MAALIRSLLPPLFSLALLILGSGLFNTFVSVRLELAGYSTEVIGMVTSSLYAGILIGSLWIDRWIAKVGHIRAFVVCASAATALVLFQALWINPWFWCAMRLLGGVSLAGIFIIIESWLLIQSTPAMRGGILSVYLAVFYGALSAGQLLFSISQPRTMIPFCLTAILSALSILPISLKKVPEPVIEKPVRVSLLQLFRISPLGFLGGVISGMLLAAVYGLVPVYGRELGLTIHQIGWLMAILIFGGLSLQWPMGRWADRVGRRQILNVASFATTIFASAIALAGNTPALLFTFAWFFGGFSFTIYPLSMAYACEKLQEGQIVAATGGFVLSYGIGAIAGPLLAPLAMQWLGIAGLFYFLAATTFLLGAYGLLRPKKQPADSTESTN